MNPVISFVAVTVLFLLGMAGAGAGAPLWATVPYIAVLLFLGGLVYRVMSWAKVPVPFRIPTTCGQEKSLPWIKQSTIENPSDSTGVFTRMALEVLFFRSLLRNTTTELRNNKMVSYVPSLALWAGAMVFHWSMLVIVLRHLRFLTEPVPAFVTILEQVDGFLFCQVGMPVVYTTSLFFLAALAYLLIRRFSSPRVRYISLAGDYFPLFLLLGIGISGLWLRHLGKTDVGSIKEFVMSLVTFGPVMKSTISPLFFGHFLLVCVLLAYFPFSKLVHMAGVFLSPTRNMANNNRAIRHVNPWDYPVKTHPYEEYEDEWRDKMKAAGVPVDKE